MRKSVSLIVLCGVVAVAAAKAYGASREKEKLRVVRSVELGRYMGRWYEIARFPNRFQKSCAGEVTATYTLRNDGKVTVLNQCRAASGQLKSAAGKAKVADPSTNAKLRVTFVKSLFFWPFGGDYWIIDLGPDYEYAVVGEPGRDYLWVLCRTPHMDENLYRQIVRRISAQGYQVERLVRTRQEQ
ncbi:MAG: lipocalin family protein [Acidobacteria bacterium]|nr:lipocalin family protein [Acidobacteriota bacterium]